MTVPSNQKVTIDGVEVYSQSAGFGILNTCQQFASEAVSATSKPSITVCGTGTKVTVFLRNRCEDYHHYTEVAGACNTAADSSTCVTISPATQGWLATAQSYKIE